MRKGITVTMWEMIVTLWKDYMGTGMILSLFLIAVIYLLIVEKRKEIRILLVYVPLTVLALFLCPLFAKLIYHFVGDEIYYRILWLLPITPTIAYAAVSCLKALQGRARLWAGVCMAVIVVLCGDFVYDNPYFSKAENAYHVPKSVEKICDEIVVEGREVMAVFPAELLQYVRQYDPTVCMPYGREVLVDRWMQGNLLYEAMESETVDAKRVAELAKPYGCHFVILKETKEINGKLEDYDYVLEDTVEGYRIYRDTTMYLGLWDEEAE